MFQTVCVCTNDSDRSVLVDDAVNCEDYTALAVDKDMNMEHWWNDTDPGGGTEVLRKRLPLVPLSPPQIPNASCSTGTDFLPSTSGGVHNT